MRLQKQQQPLIQNLNVFLRDFPLLRKCLLCLSLKIQPLIHLRLPLRSRLCKRIITRNQTFIIAVVGNFKRAFHRAFELVIFPNEAQIGAYFFQ